MNFKQLYSFYKKQWELFWTDRNDKLKVREIVLNSWQRCRNIKLDPFEDKQKCYKYTGNDLEKLLKENEILLKVSEPYLNTLKNIISDTGFIIVLGDRNGVILKVIGDQNVVEKAETEYFRPGAVRSEEIAGTNAIALCLKTGQPIQTFSSENYNVFHHDWTCSAAPIKDVSGNIAGFLNLSGKYDKINKHTLGAVVSLTKAIEKEYQIKYHDHFTNAILNAIEEGIILINNSGIIENINISSISNLTGFVKPEEIIGKNISEVLHLKTPISELITKHRSNKPVFFNTGNSKMFLRFCPVKDEKNSNIGSILMINPTNGKPRNTVKTEFMARYTFDDLIGKNDRFLNIIEQAKVIADTDATILIQGESGTGKELLSQAIHNASGRKLGPFIGINCGAIPENLIESELFGYTEGTFTGAVKGGKPGKFELANGGTIFLDEIDSMPIQMQTKLLRVIQERKLIPLGGSKPIDLDIRIISASGDNLFDKVQNGTFRKDLFYRLAVVILNLPPLRERKEDIPLLLEHFKNVKCSLHGISCGKYFTEDFIENLLNYDFPGNVRELENIVERAVILSKDSTFIDSSKLRIDGWSNGFRNILENQKEDKENVLKIPIMPLEQIESYVIKKALELTDNNVSEAAHLLGVSRNTIYNKTGRPKRGCCN